MTIPTFPSLRGQAFPVARSPLWDTLKQLPISGKETRLQLWTAPRWKWNVPFNVLPADASGSAGFGTNTDFQTLAGFWNQVAGSALPFHWTDPYDNAVTAASLGSGDGATTAFNFIRPFGGFAEPIQDVTQNTVSVYVDDYQGNLLWLDTPRTNYLEYSQAMSTAPWTLFDATAVTGQTDPLGGTTAVALKETAVNGAHSTFQTVVGALPATGVTLTFSAFIAPLGRTKTFFVVNNLDGTSYTAYFNLTGAGSVGTTTGSGVTAGIAALAGGYYRCWVSLPSGGGSTAPEVIVRPSITGADSGSYPGNTADGLYVWGAQLENNTTAGNYIATTATQQTRTDYSFATDTNWGLTYGLTFAAAPASAAAITWTGSYRWPCRFDEDSADFDNFMWNLYNLKKCSFTSMKVV